MSMKEDIKNIIFGNSYRLNKMCDDIKDGQIIGLRTGNGLEFDNLAESISEYIKDLLSSTRKQVIEEAMGKFNKQFRYSNGFPAEGSLELTHNNVRDLLKELIKE